MSTPALVDLGAVAQAAARAAGEHALLHQARRQDAMVRTAHDVKLVLDHECQAVAEGVIHRAFPNHHFLGEEGGAVGDGSTDDRAAFSSAIADAGAEAGVPVEWTRAALGRHLRAGRPALPCRAASPGGRPRCSRRARCGS